MQGFNLRQLLVYQALPDSKKQKEINKWEQYFQFQYEEELGFMIHYFDRQCSISIYDLIFFIKKRYIHFTIGQGIILSLKIIEHLLELHQMNFTFGKISLENIWMNLEGISARILCKKSQMIFYRIQFVNIQNDYSQQEDFDHIKKLIFDLLTGIKVQFCQNAYLQKDKCNLPQNVTLLEQLIKNLQNIKDINSYYLELKQLQQYRVNTQTQFHLQEEKLQEHSVTFNVYEYFERNLSLPKGYENRSSLAAIYIGSMIVKVKSQFLTDHIVNAVAQKDKSLLINKVDYIIAKEKDFFRILEQLENMQDFQNWLAEIQEKYAKQFENQFKLKLTLDQNNLENLRILYSNYQIYKVASSIKSDIFRNSLQQVEEEIKIVQDLQVKPFIENLYKIRIQELFELEVLLLISELI